MVVVSEPRPLVSVTLSDMWSLCQNGGSWMSQCLCTASTMHGFHRPFPLQPHGGAAETTSYRHLNSQ